MQPFPPGMLNFGNKPMTQGFEVKDTSQDATLYIGNLPLQMEDTLLYEMFRPYGSITSAKVKKDVFSFDSKGYGFVTYSNKAEAQKAMEALRYKECEGQELQIYFKKPN